MLLTLSLTIGCAACPQVYAFKRLCRGLGSSRQGARQGFSLAMTSLLASTQCIAPTEAVAAIEGVLEPAAAGKVRGG